MITAEEARKNKDSFWNKELLKEMEEINVAITKASLVGEVCIIFPLGTNISPDEILQRLKEYGYTIEINEDDYNDYYTLTISWSK